MKSTWRISLSIWQLQLYFIELFFSRKEDSIKAHLLSDINIHLNIKKKTRKKICSSGDKAYDRMKSQIRDNVLRLYYYLSRFYQSSAVLMIDLETFKLTVIRGLKNNPYMSVICKIRDQQPLKKEYDDKNLAYLNGRKVEFYFNGKINMWRENAFCLGVTWNF